MINKLLISCSTLLLTACASMYSNNPDSLGFSIPKGSTMSLNKKLTIPHSDTHAVIQDGETTTDHSKNDYAINCRINFKDFGPRTIKPEKFNVTRTEDGTTWVSQPSILRFYTEVYLSSNNDTDIIKMVCQEYGGPSDRNFTVAEMQSALGDYITFIFVESK